MNQINIDYDNIIQSHPKEMRDAILFMHKEMDRRHVRFGKERLNAFLKPVFISQEHDQQFGTAIEHIMNILEKVAKLYFTHPDLRSLFYIEEKAHKYLQAEPGYSKAVVISRPDAFLSPAGDIKFVEFNCDSPAGAGLADIEEEIFKKTFPIKEIAEKYQLEHRKRLDYLLKALLECYREFANTEKKPCIAICDWKEVRTQGEFKVIRKYFKEQGYDTIIADPRELKYRDGKMWHKTFSIDLIYRRAIFKEIMEREDDCADFLNAYCDNAVCVVNPLRSRLVSTKATLTIMTNHREFRHLFSEEENHFIAKHVPWTRLVMDMQTHYEDNLIFLLKHIVNHKDSLVLKPADSYGGKNVTIGRETKQEDWTNLVNKILVNKEDWVVQKYVEVTEMGVPELNGKDIQMLTKKYNLNPFVFGHRYAGSMARLSDERVINVSAGGGLVPAVKYGIK